MGAISEMIFADAGLPAFAPPWLWCLQFLDARHLLFAEAQRQLFAPGQQLQVTGAQLPAQVLPALVLLAEDKDQLLAPVALQ